MEKKDIILEKLKAIFENEESLKIWLSIPNKLFRNRPPIDLLESGNYDYFERFFHIKI